MNDYRVRGILGRGAFGIVYLVHKEVKVEYTKTNGQKSTRIGHFCILKSFEIITCFVRGLMSVYFILLLSRIYTFRHRSVDLFIIETLLERPSAFQLQSDIELSRAHSLNVLNVFQTYQGNIFMHDGFANSIYVYICRLHPTFCDERTCSKGKA